MNLDDMKLLTKGFDTYHADPPTAEVIEAVRYFLTGKSTPIHLEPMSDGGIMIHFMKIRYEFYNTGELVSMRLDASGNIKESKWNEV